MQHRLNSLIAAAAVVLTMTLTVESRAQRARPAPAKSLLAPDNHTLILIDHQPQMAFATKSIDIVELRNNVAGVAKAAKLFGVPTILTTVAEKTFSGPLFPEIKAVFPNVAPIDRTTMNTWEDKRITDRVNQIGRKKIVIAALWTEVCGVGPVLSAIEQGYQVYFISDASGGVSRDAHERAMQRMVQAGAVPITWLQYLLELQRDWARSKTYVGTNDIAKENGGGYGLGLIYAKEMFGAEENK